MVAVVTIVLTVRSDKNLYIIGLTGGIASGKTTVANILKKKGAAVLDADKVSKELVKKGEPAFKDIIKVFGNQVVDKEGNLKRNELSKIVFYDDTMRLKLEKIIHPRVIENFKQKIEEIKKNSPNKIIVMDVPLLIESNMNKMTDEVWVVAVSKEIQLQRIIDRDKISYKDALRKIESQMPLEEKLKYADRVINTDKTLKDTEKKVISFWNDIKL